MNQSHTSIKVSVLVMTYNHAKFISKAIDSALMQETGFNYEIIVSEDCSTDGTRNIVLDYHQRFPGKIRLLLSDQNIHTNAVVTRGINAAKGKYIALLDGDDYWTSPDKLQKQADFLDSHSECSMCFHNAQAFNEDSNQQPWNWTAPNQKEFSTLDDLWGGNFIATCSTMFRNNLFEKIPDWYDSFFPITDWPLYILIAEHGKIGYINEVMGAYRLHSGGLYSPYSEKQKLKKTLDFYRRINKFMNFKYDKIINTAISVFFYEWAEEYKKRKNFRSAIECFNVYLSAKPVNVRISLKKAIKLGMKLYVFHGFTFLFSKKKAT
jgi:glycosyltransferase involved in cell wall biosynthesis